MDVRRRQRKRHNNSRLGCKNCKLRHVKCDETRPACRKCTAFGVSCNYDPNTPDLQLRTGQGICVDAPDKPCFSTNGTMLGMINVSLNRHRVVPSRDGEIFRLESQDLERLCRFQTRTVLTIGTKRTAEVYQNEVIKLACVHPYVMHAVQTFTAIHDRYLSTCSGGRSSPKELYHWGQTAAVFNEKLSLPISSCDRDALWITAIFLAGIALASTEATRPEEAWPLQSSSSSCLTWLRMIDGKRAIGNITDPLRKDSVFHQLAHKDEQDYPFPLAPKPQRVTLPSGFVDLCNLAEPSASEVNPYYKAVHDLAPLLDIECDQSTILDFLGFFGQTKFEFMGLLERKDARALLLLAYWYAKVCKSVWWVARRAMLECQATCIYLERHHSDNTALMELLYLPKLSCGLVP